MIILAIFVLVVSLLSIYFLLRKIAINIYRIGFMEGQKSALPIIKNYQKIRDSVLANMEKKS